MKSWGGTETASEPNSHYASNFILQKLLVQMVNNSSLTASGDRAHLNFLHLSNLYNAHKLRKVPTRSTIDKFALEVRGLAAGLGSTGSFWSNVSVELHVWSSEHLTLLTCSSSNQYNLCISMYIHVLRIFFPLPAFRLSFISTKSYFTWQIDRIRRFWECALIN